MADLSTLKPEDLQGLAPEAATAVVTRMLAELAAKTQQLQQHEERARRYEHEIRFKDAKLEKVTIELALLKAWKFGARTERMNAAQRQMFEETAAEDEADLQAQLQQLQGQGDWAAPDSPDTLNGNMCSGERDGFKEALQRRVQERGRQAGDDAWQLDGLCGA